MDKWDLTRIIESDEVFKKKVEDFRCNTLKQVSSFKGSLNDPEKLKGYLILTKECNEELAKILFYASMASDLNKKDVKASENGAIADQLLSDYFAADSFSRPEILALGEDKVKEFLADNPELQEFDFTLLKLFKMQKYTLDTAKEELLSAYKPLSDEGASLYSALTVGDWVNTEVTLSDGKKVAVSQGNWRGLIEETKDPHDRFLIFKAIFSYYEERKTAYGEIYNSVLKAELAEMKTRGYDSILQSHLYPNNIPLEVFTTLIKTASENTEPLKRYLQLKKEWLGLTDYYTYDRFLQLSYSDKKYTYQEAKEFFLHSLEKFPADFQNKAHEVLKEGYVDVYEQPGKRSGAYSNGGENIHPYILLNFNGNLDDVFTLAHESGHSIHTLYAMENQPLMKQDYTIFVAEIASTFNEHNLLDYLISSGKLTKNEKIMLLQKAIDNIVSTFYRQTLFAHFEWDLSKKAENGEPINYDVCNKEMIELYKQYYGLDIEKEEVKKYVWAYIPHIFYTPFYVYQYATSFTASMHLYQAVKDGEEGAFDRYLGLLKSGGSAYPIDQVKAAGVDLTKKEPYEDVIKRMAELVDELAEVMKE
ncbi:MAG: oligoendopeptidase F [Bacilli bacterium]|jgi:oligoendopeptidase F|nr:oligoendopeptidase F [Bacilli bacterium]